jgi:hypothetical protein
VPALDFSGEEWFFARRHLEGAVSRARRVRGAQKRENLDLALV